MKYQAIEACKAEFPVSRLCRVLNIAESGYYAWLNRAPSPHEQENLQLQQTICTIWKQYRCVYGAPRIQAELQEQGISVGHNRVARLMRQAGIQGKTVCKRRPHTTQSDPTHPVVANGLDRHFTAHHPNEVWLTDITSIDTAEGFLYLAAVMDLYSRQIVVWSWRTICVPNWSKAHSTWHSRSVVRRATYCIIRIVAANTPALITRNA